jgi:hypothetical protein
LSQFQLSRRKACSKLNNGRAIMPKLICGNTSACNRNIAMICKRNNVNTTYLNDFQQ